MRHTLKSAGRVPKVSQDRGLTSSSSRQLSMSKIGPGTYCDESKNAFPTRMTQSITAETSITHSRNVKRVGSFGSAHRDVHFSKYASLHSDLVRKGLH